MSIQPQFESYRYVGEVCRLKGQTVVEYRLPGSEISSILAIHAKAIPTESTCADGEVQYGGKALLSIVYEDGDRKICRSERGAEFFHKTEGSAVTPSCFAKVWYTAENVSFRREGSGLYVSVILGAEIAVYGGRQMEYLSRGEGLICKTEPLTLCKTVCVSGEVEGEDEFDCDYVGDILLHSENAVAHHVSASAGQIDAEGEIALHICVLRGDESVCSYERLIPFRMQIPCEEAFGSVNAGAKITVKSAHLTAATDEEKGKSRMVLAYTLAADCLLSVKEELSAATDAFSTEQEIAICRTNEGGRYLTKQLRWTERVSGVGSLSPALEGEVSLQAAVLPRVELVCRKGENGMEAEGVLLAEVLVKNGEGSFRAATLSLPFLFPVEMEGEYAEGECLACGLNVRRKKSGEVEAEATLKLALRGYEEKEWSYVSKVDEGEAYPEEKSAFTVFLPPAGEELWSLAKRLHCSPESLEKNNPDLEFPLKKGERIFVYRQIK